MYFDEIFLPNDLTMPGVVGRKAVMIHVSYSLSRQFIAGKQFYFEKLEVEKVVKYRRGGRQIALFDGLVFFSLKYSTGPPLNKLLIQGRL